MNKIALIAACLCAFVAARAADGEHLAAPAASPPATTATPPSMDDPGPDDMSSKMGLTAGQSTTDDVEQKLGSSYRKTPGPNGHFTYMYFKQNFIVVCLFNGSNILVRTIVYAQNP